AGASSPPLTLFLHAGDPPHPRRPSFPTRRSSDLPDAPDGHGGLLFEGNISASCPTGRYLQGHHALCGHGLCQHVPALHLPAAGRSEEHTSELQSRENLVCRPLLEQKSIRVSTLSG